MAEQSSNSWAEGTGPEITARTADGTVTAGDPLAESRQRIASAIDAPNETLASWVDAASDQLRHMANRLRDRPASELADDLARFARERPALFIGGAFLLGLGVARLLKSSPQSGWQGGSRGGVQERGAYTDGARPFATW